MIPTRVNMNGVTLVQFQYRQTVPLGAAYLVCGLEETGIHFELKLFSVGNFYRRGRKVELLYSFLSDSKDIIALGCFSDMLPYALTALKKIKQKFPKKILILGGVGPTNVAGEILETFNFIDFIIKGCGVLSLPKLIKKIKAKKNNYNNIPGLCFRNKHTVNNNAENCLSETPKIPAYHRIKNLKAHNWFLIRTGLGCPYQCTFCYALPAAGRRVVYRDIYEVIEEIKLIKEINNGKEFILRIIDEAFVVDRKRVLEFCSLLRKNKLDISWVCYGRADRMDEELLRNMSMAGCKEVYYGVESGSNRILKKIKKGFTIEEAFKIALLSKKYIPGVTASFIYRYPFETLNDFIDTLTALRYLQFKEINTQLHPLVPVKNSEIYLTYGDSLRFSEKEPCDYLSGQPVGFMPKECIELVKNNFRVFYDYGYYNSDELDKINNLIMGNRKKIFFNYVRSSW